MDEEAAEGRRGGGGPEAARWGRLRRVVVQQGFSELDDNGTAGGRGCVGFGRGGGRDWRRVLRTSKGVTGANEGGGEEGGEGQQARRGRPKLPSG